MKWKSSGGIAKFRQLTANKSKYSQKRVAFLDFRMYTLANPKGSSEGEIILGCQA